MDNKDFWIVKAKLRLRATNEGGRTRGIMSGYRPNHVFEYENGSSFSTYIGDIKFDGQETIEPGEEKIVTVRFLSKQPIKAFLIIGRRWWIHEGPNLVAEAEIVEIYLPIV